MVSAFCVYFTAILENDIAVGGNTISSHVEMHVAVQEIRDDQNAISPYSSNLKPHVTRWD